MVVTCRLNRGRRRLAGRGRYAPGRKESRQDCRKGKGEIQGTGDLDPGLEPPAKTHAGDAAMVNQREGWGVGAGATGHGRRNPVLLRSCTLWWMSQR